MLLLISKAQRACIPLSSFFVIKFSNSELKIMSNRPFWEGIFVVRQGIIEITRLTALFKVILKSSKLNSLWYQEFEDLDLSSARAMCDNFVRTKKTRKNVKLRTSFLLKETKNEKNSNGPWFLTKKKLIVFWSNFSLF